VCYRKFSIRLPASLRDSVSGICKTEPQRQISDFLEAAIDAVDGNVDKLLEVYEAMRTRTRRGDPMVVSVISIPGDRADYLERLPCRLQEAIEVGRASGNKNAR